MSWYSSDYSHRAAVSVNNHGGTNTIEVSIVIPSEWPEFWDLVLSSGNDVVVTEGNGTTVTTYKLASWDYAAKTGTIHVDNLGASSTGAALTLWVYWGKTGASSQQSSFTHSTTPKTGTIQIAVPGSGSSPIVSCRPEPPGATSPRTEIAKASGEDIHVWWDLSRVLSRRRIPYQNTRHLEEVDNVRYTVESQGSAVTSMSDNASICQVGDFIRTTIKGGSSGTNYVAILTVITDETRVLDFRCAIRVSDVTEPT
jgi:hypothetical protein